MIKFWQLKFSPIEIAVGLCLFPMAFSPTVFAAEQKEMLKVRDSLCCYAYNPAPSNDVKPLFIGDTVPADWYLYLPDVTSRLILVKGEGAKEMVFKEPGIYDSEGAKAKVPISVKNLISRKGESCQAVRFNAEGMLKGKDSPEEPLELDDPQRVPSPSA